MNFFDLIKFNIVNVDAKCVSCQTGCGNFQPNHCQEKIQSLQHKINFLQKLAAKKQAEIDKLQVPSEEVMAEIIKKENALLLRKI